MHLTRTMRAGRSDYDGKSSIMGIERKACELNGFTPSIHHWYFGRIWLSKLFFSMPI